MTDSVNNYRHIDMDSSYWQRLRFHQGTPSGSMKKTADEIKQKCRTVEEDLDGQLEGAWDDVSGAQLDPKAVRRTRSEEVSYIHNMNLYSKVPIADCYQKTHNAPISVRWVDISKGDTECFNYRSRLVAREINTYKRDDLFVVTPPLEALTLLLSMVTSGDTAEVVMVNDVSRAFFPRKGHWRSICTAPSGGSEARREKNVRPIQVLHVRHAGRGNELARGILQTSRRKWLQPRSCHAVRVLP